MRSLYFLAIGSLFFISCYTPRYMYSPAAQNVPVFAKKGDSKLSAGLSTNFSQNSVTNNLGNDSKSRGFDLQGAYAYTNAFAIQANYFNRNESNTGNEIVGTLDNAFINYKRHLTEVGFGYFNSFDKTKLALFQVFGGVGKGKFGFKDNGQDQNGVNYSRSHEADVTKYYFQPALMLRSKGNFAASFSSRFSFIKFSNIKSDYSPSELVNYKLDSLSDGTHNFWEPAFTNTFGFKQLPGIQFEYQFGTAIQTNGGFIHYRSINFFFAIVLDLPKLLNRKSGNDKN